MPRNRDKAVGYWLGIAVGVTAVLFVLAADRARAADDPKDEKIKQLQAELDKAKKEAEELRLQKDEMELRLLRLELLLKQAEFDRKQDQRQQKVEKLLKEITEEKLKVEQML